MTVLSRFIAFTHRHPIARGMISYAIIWPTSSLIQQTIAGKRWNNYDWAQVVKYGLYGACFTAPTLYSWLRISTMIWPGNNFKTAVTKAVVENVTYGPTAIACFFFGMSLLDNKKVDQAVEEVKLKFLPTYKVAVCFWPFVQTVNFLMVPERNRVPVVSVCSLVWCCFLAYMHELQSKQEEQLQFKRALLES